MMIVDCHLLEVLGEKTWCRVVESLKVRQTVRLKTVNGLSTFVVRIRHNWFLQCLEKLYMYIYCKEFNTA